MTATDYVHRVGRTARAEAGGRATSFYVKKKNSHLVAKIQVRLLPQRPSFFFVPG